MDKNIDFSLKVTDKVIDTYSTMLNFLNKEELAKEEIRQIRTSVHPVIANAMYARENDLLANERMKTLVSLARVLDDENLEKAVNGLRYEISVKKA